VLFASAFIPARYAPPPELEGEVLPFGEGAEVWSFVTQMLLHGDWVYLPSTAFRCWPSAACWRAGSAAGGSCCSMPHRQPWGRPPISACTGAAFRSWSAPREGALVFLGVWFAITILAGAFSYDRSGEGARIACEAHVGGEMC
jgi:membrane associated rhomboid family serine protease